MPDATYRVIILHRWMGGPAEDWYQWLAETLERRGHSVQVLKLPTPDLPRIDNWLPALDSAVRGEPEAEISRDELARTVLIGHSLGSRAILLWLQQLGPGLSVAGCLFVACWWRLNESWPILQPWLDEPVDYGQVREASPRICVLLGGRDPYAVDQSVEAQQWEERVGATVRVIPESGHFFFNAVEPEVLRSWELCFEGGR